MGKSTLVTQLAERVNISNILQTSVVKQVVTNFDKIPDPEESPLSQKEFDISPESQKEVHQLDKTPDQRVEEACASLDIDDEESIIDAFRLDCRKVRDGCNFDISKCFKDGKPLIIDGSHVDPEFYVKQIKCDSKNRFEYRIVTEA